MMILSKNKGISNYYEVCDIELTGSYEEKMLINNHMKYLPDAEVRTLDNRRSMYGVRIVREYDVQTVRLQMFTENIYLR